MSLKYICDPTAWIDARHVIDCSSLSPWTKNRKLLLLAEWRTDTSFGHVETLYKKFWTEQSRFLLLLSSSFPDSACAQHHRPRLVVAEGTASRLSLIKHSWVCNAFSVKAHNVIENLHRGDNEKKLSKASSVWTRLLRMPCRSLQFILVYQGYDQHHRCCKP